MLPAVALVVGAAVGGRLDFLPVPLAVLLAAAGVALGGRPGRLVAAFAAGLVAAAVLAGPPAVEAVDPARPVELVGRIAGHWQWGGQAWSAPLRVERLVQGRRVVRGRGEAVRLSLPGVEAPPPFGSRLRLRGHLRRSAGYANALPVEPGPWRLYVKSRRLVEVEAPPGRLAALAAGLRCRVEAGQAAAVREAREGSTWEGEPVRPAPAAASEDRRRPGSADADRPPSAPAPAVSEGAGDPAPCAFDPLDPDRLEPGPALVRALVLGDTSAVPPPWRRGLRRAGLAHVLAVSGLHVGLVAAAALLLAAPLRPPLLRVPVVLLAVGLYLLVAGPRPALLRATLMAALAAASLLARRPPVAGNALAVTVALLVLHRPVLVDDLGFRLTAAATAGLVFLAPPAVRRVRARLAEWAGRQPATVAGAVRELPLRLASGLAAPLGAAVAAQLASSPFALPAFHLFSPTSPLSNLVAVPWTALTLAAGLGWSGLALAFPGRAAGWLPLLDRLAAPFGWPALGEPEDWGTVAVVAPPAACWLLVAAAVGCLGWGLSRGPGGGRPDRRRREGGVSPFRHRPGSGPAPRAGRRAGGEDRGWGWVRRGWPVRLRRPPGRLLRVASAGCRGSGCLLRPLLRSLVRSAGRGLPWVVLLLVAAALAPVVRWGWGGPPAAGERVSVTFLDVGQGDAVLLRDGERAVLVDGGGWRRGDLGGRVLLPALLGEGVARLDAVVLTHTDRDHCGGLVDLASYLPVEEVWTAEGWQDEPCGAELVAAVTEEDPRALRLLAAGDGRWVGRWWFSALHPEAASGGPAERLRAVRRAVGSARRNDHSLVLRAEALGRHVLLTGDVEAGAERGMLRRDRAAAALSGGSLSGGSLDGGSAERHWRDRDWQEREWRERGAGNGGFLRSDFLKVAHHGSRTSSWLPFLRRVAPRLAVVSAGRDNLYHHPAGDVVERFQRLGILLLRTDRDGAVCLSWTGSPGFHLTTGRVTP